MRIQIFFPTFNSDGDTPSSRSRSSMVPTQIVVGGDTCEGAFKAFQTLRRVKVPETLLVIMVAGNHEYYGRFVGQELLLAKACELATSIFISWKMTRS